MIKKITPEYEVTIGSAYFCFIESKGDTITYETEVIEVPTIRTLGLTRNVSELEVWASGQMFDYINRTAGAEIALNAVTLPSNLLNKIEGATVDIGSTINRTSDIEREFAFGYWGENNDGSLTFIWHPVCKLIPTEENHETRSNDIADPQRDYSVKILPFQNIWRHRYSTKKATTSGYNPLTIEQFFSKPTYLSEQLPAHTPVGETINGV